MNFNLQQWIPGMGPEHDWIIQVFAIVLVTAVIGLLAQRALRKLARKVTKTKTNWDDIVLAALSRPLSWIIWIQGLDVASDVIYVETQSNIFSYSDSIRNVGVLVCITWFVLTVIRGAEQEFANNSDNLDETTAHAIGKLLRMVVIITAGLVILQTLGYSISGVLAMGGVGGIAVGFAAKDLLANFFGGLIVYLDRPFAVGDWIRSPDREIEGTVEYIGWRVTRIRNFESRPLYVPNSVFTNVIVENPSRMANRRFLETIGLRYSDLSEMNRIVDEVTTMLNNHEEVDTDKIMIVNFNEFAGSSVDFFVYCYTRTTEWKKFHQVKQDLMLRIAEIIEANHAEIAFPTSTLHIADPVTLSRT